MLPPGLRTAMQTKERRFHPPSGESCPQKVTSLFKLIQTWPHTNSWNQWTSKLPKNPARGILLRDSSEVEGFQEAGSLMAALFLGSLTRQVTKQSTFHCTP